MKSGCSRNMEPKTLPSGKVPGVFDLGLIALTIVYLAFVGVSGVGSDLYSSTDQVTDDGRVWLLVTSALNVVSTLATVQWVLLAAAVAFTVYRVGPRIWWVVAISGHIGAAMISYAVIELAIALGSQSADHTASQADYGVSIILGATLGALTASAMPFRRTADDPMDAGDRAALWIGLAGLAGMLIVSFGWYDVQHPLGYAIGFLLCGWLRSRSSWQMKFTD